LYIEGILSILYKLIERSDFHKYSIFNRQFSIFKRFGLTIQLCRAAASVSTNIAKGCGRDSERELARFMSIAAGSASEVEYHLLLACDLNYIQE